MIPALLPFLLQMPLMVLHEWESQGFKIPASSAPSSSLKNTSRWEFPGAQGGKQILEVLAGKASSERVRFEVDWAKQNQEQEKFDPYHPPTHPTKCPENLAPQIHGEIPEAAQGKAPVVVSSGANQRFNSGVCAQREVKYFSATAILACGKNLARYSVFVPIKKRGRPSESDRALAVQTVSKLSCNGQ